MSNKIMLGIIIGMTILFAILCGLLVYLLNREPSVTTMENQSVSESETERPEESLPEETAESETVPAETTVTEAETVPAPTEQPEAPVVEQPVPVKPTEAPNLPPFRAALESLYQNQTCAGETYVLPEDFYYLEGNRFAIYDVDGDGGNELILLWENTYTASQIGTIFGKDSSGTLYVELREYPLLTFYSNHLIEAGISHNQGYAGRFWPYTMYQHNASTDQYEAVYDVGAWDGVEYPEVFGDPFPVEEDTCGMGILYTIFPKDGSPKIECDAVGYEDWHNAVVGTDPPLELPFVYLTPENIAAVNE